MGLQSQLFRGDLKLEAAAVSDPEHIIPGSGGTHVGKIQIALIQLDGAAIGQPELDAAFYGTSTAAAVLAYKQKRNIVNRSYQTFADNIVGKMTMTSLDQEMLKKEAVRSPAVRILPLLPVAQHNYVKPVFRDFDFLALVEANSPFSDRLRTLVPGGTETSMNITVNAFGTFQVVHGAGGWVRCADKNVGFVFDPANPQVHGGAMRVTKDPHVFAVRGIQPGRSSLQAWTGPASGPGSAEAVTLMVAAASSPTVFHTLTPHGHTPCGRWKDIQANPNSSHKLNALCKLMNPRQLVGAAIEVELSGQPLALAHVKWYLSGSGANFPEDLPLRTMLERDSAAQAMIRNHFLAFTPASQRRGIVTKQIKEFDNYAIDEFKNSFGTIDILDYEVDLDARTVRVWFQDRYEWHPVYQGLYSNFPDDNPPRPTNCVHAAFVELKSFEDIRAADFWMAGEATVPLDVIFPTGTL